MTGLSDEKLAEIRAGVVRWMADADLPDNTLPASPDDVLALLAEVDRLRGERDMWEKAHADECAISNRACAELRAARDAAMARADRLAEIVDAGSA